MEAYQWSGEEVCDGGVFPVFSTMADRMGFAAEWVQNNRDVLAKKMKAYNSRITGMDIEDMLGDAVIILAEATVTGERKGIPWYAVFWKDFDFMMIGSQGQCYVDTETFECDSAAFNLLPSYDMLVHDEELAGRRKREETEEAALRSALNLLAPAERRAVELVAGLTDYGCLSTYEAAEVMKITKASLFKMLTRAKEKIEQAGKLYFHSGMVMLFPVPWKQKRGRKQVDGPRSVRRREAKAELAAC